MLATGSRNVVVLIHTLLHFGSFPFSSENLCKTWKKKDNVDVLSCFLPCHLCRGSKEPSFVFLLSLCSRDADAMLTNAKHVEALASLKFSFVTVSFTRRTSPSSRERPPSLVQKSYSLKTTNFLLFGDGRSKGTCREC